MTDNNSGTESRPHRSRAKADHLAAEYEASGLSRDEFCGQAEVSLQSLARYVTRYRKQKAENTQPQRWVAVELAGHDGCGGGELAVLLSSGRRIEVKRGFDASTLRQLVAVLEQA